MAYLLDIEIAQQCKPEHIKEIAKRAHVDEKYIEIVSKAIKERKSKSGIHTYLVKNLKNQQIATEIYNKIKPLLKDKS